MKQVSSVSGDQPLACELNNVDIKYKLQEALLRAIVEKLYILQSSKLFYVLVTVKELHFSPKLRIGNRFFLHLNLWKSLWGNVRDS